MAAVTAFIPATAPKLAVARDGLHAVIVDGGRAAAIRIADRQPICELVLPAGEVAWLGVASRLLVVSAADSHTDVRLIDPFSGDARRVAEIRLDSAMRLGAANGTHALLLGARTAAVLSGGELNVTPYQFLARVIPQVVGVAGSQFVVALPGTIEEWDPASRMPKRRLRLPKVAPITSLGGSERVLWMTTTQDPHRLEVLPLVNRGQPKAHELPEPIGAVSGHPNTDAVICIGAETGRIYAIDLDGRSRLRTIALPGIDRANAAALVVRGATLSVIAAQAGRPIATAPLDITRDDQVTSPSLPAIKVDPAARGSSSLYDEEPVRPRTVAEALRRPEAETPAPRTITEALRQSSLAQAEENTRAPTVAESLRRRLSGEEPATARTMSEALRRTGEQPVAPRTMSEAVRRTPIDMSEIDDASVEPPMPSGRPITVPPADAPSEPRTTSPRAITVPPADSPSEPRTISPRRSISVPPVDETPSLGRTPSGSREIDAPSVSRTPSRPRGTGVPSTLSTEGSGPTPVAQANEWPTHTTDGPSAPRTISEAIRFDDDAVKDWSEPVESIAVDSELVVPRQPSATAWSEGASELMAKLASLRAPRDHSPDAPQRASWRDDAGAWARAVASGTFDRAAPGCPPIEVLATRFELPAALIPALVLLYGSHLAGMQGAAPMDLAKVLGRRWDDALGRGKLAELGLAVYADSRVRLAPVIQRVLDELPPSGELIGEPGVVSLLGPTVLVSREPIRVLGVRVVEQLGGAVLLGSYVDAMALALEARALGALAVGHVDLSPIPHHPILIVVGDERVAEQIDLPRFELSPPSHAT